MESAIFDNKGTYYISRLIVVGNFNMILKAFLKMRLH